MIETCWYGSGAGAGRLSAAGFAPIGFAAWENNLEIIEVLVDAGWV